MPGTQKRRRRKRRGTQGGSVDARAARGRPRNRQEARARAKSRARAPQRGTAGQREPTWRGAINRALIAAGIFFALLLLLFKRPAAEAIGLSAFMLLVYVPMGYYLDKFFYRIRMRREARDRAQRQAGDAKK